MRTEEELLDQNRKGKVREKESCVGARLQRENEAL